MLVNTSVYANLLDKATTGQFDWASHAIKCGLLTSAYTPDLVGHVLWSDVSGSEVAASGGYSAGGLALATKTHIVAAANSWGSPWSVTTAYTVGGIVRPVTGNGYLYRCAVAGTSGSSEPTWPTVVGQSVTDGSVVWSCAGRSITQWSSAAVQWASSTITARYGVIYDSITGVLVCLLDLGADRSTVSSNFTLAPAVGGWFVNVLA